MSYAKWIWSCNHKDIGTLYLIAGVWAGMIGTGLRIKSYFRLNASLIPQINILKTSKIK